MYYSFKLFSFQFNRSNLYSVKGVWVDTLQSHHKILPFQLSQPACLQTALLSPISRVEEIFEGYDHQATLHVWRFHARARL